MLLARPGVAWLLLGLVLAGGALAGTLYPRTLLDWQPALVMAEPWRAFSAAFVHLSTRHLLANLLGCVVVTAFGLIARVPWWITLAWLLAWPLGHALLWLQPALQHYAGLSGVLHGGTAAAALYVALRGQGHEPIIGWGVLLGLGVKLYREAPWRGPVQHVAGWDIPIAPIAHATGTLAALLCAAAALALARAFTKERSG
ncbi:rhombosortase [Aquincola tertiaricarbonis]|uniref:rhombosortase n=1 Tax=Aquincola tertiaricarbonis TaxID=391953 RepID=UPI00069678DA|nr:rhombosortase [Aquincola tertiaricarbonis]